MPTTSTIHELEAQIAALEAANQALERECVAQQQLIDDLRGSEAKFAHAFNCNAAVLSISTLKEGRYIEVNDTFCQLLGYTRLEVIGKTSQELNLWVDDHDRDRIVAVLQRDGTVRNWDVPVLDKHGNRHIGIFSADLITVYGEPHLLVTVNDITERKKAEAEIRRLNAELESRVKQRTAELEATNRELKDFAYSVSHDLKAPLRAISRLGQWLVDDYAMAFDDNGKEMVAMLIQRVQRMDSLIDGILEYSRVGRIVGETLPVDLNRLIPEILEQIAPPPNIYITIETLLPTVFGDKIRLFQVFQNLFSNAIRFMDKPEGQIAVGCVDEDMQWRLSVNDNGSGIDPRDHERIFQIFQTVHARDELESTGVGLAIVKKIVEFYGGQVGVESTPGNGSRFWFTWPKQASIETTT